MKPPFSPPAHTEAPQLSATMDEKYRPIRLRNDSAIGVNHASVPLSESGVGPCVRCSSKLFQLSNSRLATSDCRTKKPASNMSCRQPFLAPLSLLGATRCENGRQSKFSWRNSLLSWFPSLRSAAPDITQPFLARENPQESARPFLAPVLQSGDASATELHDRATSRRGSFLAKALQQLRRSRQGYRSGSACPSADIHTV